MEGPGNVSDTTDVVEMTTAAAAAAAGWDPAVVARVTAIAAAARLVNIGCLLPILVLGVTGNVIALMLMARHAWKSSTHLYLSALSVVDTVFLVGSVTVWMISALGGGRLDPRDILDCNTVSFLLYVPKQISAWLLVVVSVERALVVYLPTRARLFTDIRLARGTLGLMFAILLGINWMSLGAWHTNHGDNASLVDYRCRGRTPYLEMYRQRYYPVIVSTFYSYMPSIALVILNAAIIAKFLRASRKTKVGDASSTGDAGTSAPSGSRTLAKNSRRMTVTGVTLSVTFLLLTIPTTLVEIYANLERSALQKQLVRYYLVYLYIQILGVFTHLNHAINFALYCLTSSKFRADLYKLFRCRLAMKGGEFSLENTASTMK